MRKGAMLHRRIRDLVSKYVLLASHHVVVIYTSLSFSSEGSSKEKGSSMSLDQTTVTSVETVKSSYTGPIIDTDVHEAFTSLNDLVPYLQEPWCGLILRKAWTGLGAPFAYWASHGVDRGDIHVPDGVPAGSSYEQFKELVLDLYPIQ